MNGGFNNPIVGGGGALVYPSIHSPNFVTNVSGWTINKDGSAEFNNLAIRGTFRGTEFIMDSTGLYFYTGAEGFGNPPFFYVTSAATDPFGNALTASVGVNGGTGLLQFFNPVDATDFMTVADGIIQRILANILASEIRLDQNNPAVVNQITQTAKSNFALNDAITRLIAQFNSGIPAELALGLGTVIVANANNATDGNPEIWHDLRPLSNSFVGTITSEWPPQYRVTAQGDLHLFGAVQLPPSGSYNGITWATLPAGYRTTRFGSIPVAQIGGTMATDTNTGNPRLYTDSTGVLQFFGISPSLNSFVIRFSGKIPLTNAPITI